MNCGGDVGGFCWEDEGIALPTVKGHKRMHYDRFTNGSLIVCKSDFVMISGNTKANSPDDCYVAKIIDLYDKDKRTDDRHRAIIEWYLRPKDLKKYKIDLSIFKHDREIIRNDGNKMWANDIDAESIFGTCQVRFLNRTEPLPKVNETDEPVFFLRWAFTGETLVPANCTKEELEKFLPQKSSEKKFSTRSSRRKSVEKSATSPKKSSEKKFSTRSSRRKLFEKPATSSYKSSEKKFSTRSSRRKSVEKFATSPQNKIVEKPPTKRKLFTEDKNQPRSPRIKQFISEDGCFVREGFEVEKGAYVMISSTELKLADKVLFKRCFIAKVKKFYKDIRKKSEPYRAIVEWFLRPKDLRDMRLKVPELKYCNETLEVIGASKQEWNKDIDAETILDVCKIVVLDTEENVPNESFSEDDPTFYWRWTLKDRKLVPAKRSSGKTDSLENKHLLDKDVNKNAETKSPFKSKLIPAKSSSGKTDSLENKHLLDKDVNKNAETKSPFKSFYSSSKKRKAMTALYEERESKKRRLFNDNETDSNLQKEKSEAARRRLHVSVLPEKLPCREDEYDEIYSFVRGKLEIGSNGCVYISGVPGSGKTATVLAVMRNLTEERDNGDLRHFKFIALNGMKLTEPHQIYVQIVKELTGQKMTAASAVNFLAKHFDKKRRQPEHVVLLIDELDLLYTRRQDVLYNLFEWPSRQNARLIVIAVANTMNLPERIMANRVVSRVGMARITFQPYTHKQLEDIILNRLSELKTFKPDAVRFVARKIGNVSGDARRALDICRRAVEIVEDGQIVGMKDVSRAVEEMFSSPKFIAIQNASVYEQLLLRAIATQFKYSGVEECTWGDVFPDFVTLCRIEGFKAPNETQSCALCFQLSSCRLLIAEDGRKDRDQRIRLNVSGDDIAIALDCKI